MFSSLRLNLNVAPAKGSAVEPESDSDRVPPASWPKFGAACALLVLAGSFVGCFADLDYLRSGRGVDGGGNEDRQGTPSDSGAGGDGALSAQESSVQLNYGGSDATGQQAGADLDSSVDDALNHSEDDGPDLDASSDVGDGDTSIDAETDSGARGADAGPGDASYADARLDSGAADVRADGPAPPDPAPYLSMIPVTSEDGGAELGRADTNINAVPFRHNGLLTVGDYQFIAYYGLVAPPSSFGAVVGRRRVTSKAWTLTRTAFTPPVSGDWGRVSAAIQFGIDGSGVFHMGWGGGSTRCYYTRSTDSVLRDAPIALSGADVGNTGALSASTAGEVFPLSTDPSIQTTEFYNIPNSGDLLLAFRTGSTGNGHYQLARWDNTGKAWLQVHATTTGPWIQGGDETYGSPYVNQLAFGLDGALHASWTFRGHTSGVNYDLFYARSLDNGATWGPVDGTTAYASPLTWTNPAPVLQIQPIAGSFNLMNQCSMATDVKGRPIVACWYATSATIGRQIMVIWHDGHEWRTSQVTARAASDSSPNDLARPIILVDDDDRWLLFWRDSRAATTGIKFAWSSSASRDVWTALDLTTDALGQWEPVYDLGRWQRDRIVSLYYQSSGTGVIAMPVSVLEFRARDYLAVARDGG